MKMMMQQQQQQNLEAATSVTSPSSASSRPSTTASVAALVMPEQGNLSKGIDNKTVRCRGATGAARAPGLGKTTITRWRTAAAAATCYFPN